VATEEPRVGEARIGDRRASRRSPADDRLAQVLHDARQQAASLSALIHVMERGPYTVSQETMHYLARAASQLTNLLEHVLDRSTSPEPLLVWHCVDDIVMAMQLSQAVDLELIVDEEAAVVANASLLRRATSNLLENALRSAGDEGRVRFQIGRSGDSTILVVEDSGPGFGTAPRGRSSLGLGVVAELVGHVHGSFEIRRSDLGGALLRITIPDRQTDLSLEGGNRR
jgi:two-component system, OmpR family, sensor histidine kinase BaeS